MSNSSRIGATAIEVVSAVLKLHPEIAELTLFEPTSAPLAQKRLGDDEKSQSIIEAGLLIRQQLCLPFWDAVLLSCFDAGITAFTLLEKALFHNSPPRRKLSVRSSDWSPEHLGRAIQEVDVGQILVVSSRVRLRNGDHTHIPMLDFHCPVGSANQEMSVRAARLLHAPGGYLLDSGQSYHFYGKSLMPDQELRGFLGRSLLLTPIIDRAWVAHQLIEGACGLRISPKPESGKIPRVIAEL